MKARPWTIEGLAVLRLLAAAGCPLRHIGSELFRPAADCDRALWALVGRTPPQAVAILNGTRPMLEARLG